MSKSLRLLIVLTTWVGGYVLLVNVVTDGPFLFCLCVLAGFAFARLGDLIADLIEQMFFESAQEDSDEHGDD